MSKPKRLPRYADQDRYPYHFCCSKILPVRKLDGGEAWLHERTHGCWCSAWQKQADGTFLHWREGKWSHPKKGSIKSKALITGTDQIQPSIDEKSQRRYE